MRSTIAFATVFLCLGSGQPAEADPKSVVHPHDLYDETIARRRAAVFSRSIEMDVRRSRRWLAELSKNHEPARTRCVDRRLVALERVASASRAIRRRGSMDRRQLVRQATLYVRALALSARLRRCRRASFSYALGTAVTLTIDPAIPRDDPTEERSLLTRGWFR